MKIRAAVFRDESLKPSIEELELSGPQAGEVLPALQPLQPMHLFLTIVATA